MIRAKFYEIPTTYLSMVFIILNIQNIIHTIIGTYEHNTQYFSEYPYNYLKSYCSFCTINKYALTLNLLIWHFNTHLYNLNYYMHVLITIPMVLLQLVFCPREPNKSGTNNIILKTEEPVF